MGEHVESSLTKGTRVVVLRSARAAHLGDRRGREAVVRRDHRRRDRPEPALGDRRGDPCGASPETVGGSKPNTDAGFDGEPF
jgi:hypothetical protein